MSTVVGRFKAQFSNDYLQIEPIVLKYLEEHNYPALAVSSMIWDYVITQIENKFMDEDRIKHCISRALGRVGYVKRSKRGKAWEFIPEKGWNIRVADYRSRNSRPAWTKARPDTEAEFVPVDTHPVRTRKRSVFHMFSSVNVILCTFFPVFS
jgi:hypothetical protein